MSQDLFSLREEEIFKTLKALRDCDFGVIGGYSVNAYALPRFSTDCDIVIKDRKELEKIENILLEIGYIKEKLPDEAQYYGSFCRYEKKIEKNFAVSMDVFVGRVTDRMTGAEFAADWIFKNSSRKILKGKTITEELELRIIDLDALLVMKIVSCRSTDIRDVFMMLPNAKEKEWIKTEVQARCDLKDRIKKIADKISSKQFKDGLSGVYGYVDQKIFEKHVKAVLAFT
jgi:hypothetical protein